MNGRDISELYRFRSALHVRDGFPTLIENNLTTKLSIIKQPKIRPNHKRQMKSKFLFLSAVAISIASMASVNAQQTTTPVGYTTQTCYDGVFNLVGFTLHGATQATGDVASISGTTITLDDGIVDGLVGGPFLIEITSGTAAGAVNLITGFDGIADTVTTEDDLAAAGVAADDTFAIRLCPTLGSVFGTDANVVINKGSATTGDLIYVPEGGGSFGVYHHTADVNFGGTIVPGNWAKVGGGSNIANTPLIYTDAAYVLNRSGSNYDLVVSGEVKLTASKIGLPDTFNYISAVYPAGTTLDDSGLADSLGFQKGSVTTGDLVLMPDNSTGSFNSYYHSADVDFGGTIIPGQWKAVAGGVSSGGVEMTQGIIIQRRAASPYNADLGVPTSWTP